VSDFAKQIAAPSGVVCITVVGLYISARSEDRH
jgi:hypothetical protein